MKVKPKTENFDKLINKIKDLEIEDKDKKEMITLVNNINSKNVKKEIDPNLPKRPKNTFLIFMEDVRKLKDGKQPSVNFPSNKLDNVKKVILNNEGKAIKNLTKDCGELWREFTNDDKIKYVDNYKKEHNKYIKEIDKTK